MEPRCYPPLTLLNVPEGTPIDGAAAGPSVDAAPPVLWHVHDLIAEPEQTDY